MRENPEDSKARLSKKNFDSSLIDNVLALDKEKRGLLQEVEQLQAHRNAVSKLIPTLSGDERERQIGEMHVVKESLAELEGKLAAHDAELHNLLLMIPNPPVDDVPFGKDETENVVVRTVGEKPVFNFKPKDHMELAAQHDLIEGEAAAAMSGSRFYYLKNDLVLWEFALVQFVLNKLVSKGFTPILPPVLVKEPAMFATGFFPADRSDIYHVNPEDDDLYLVGTGEVPLCMLHADTIMDEGQFPKRYVAFSTCFRREAGSYGKDTQGIMRVHQFDKLEMFSFCHPDKSEEEHKFLLSIEEEIMSELGFHYQVVNICGGDLGAPAAQKFDIEVWIPSQERFRELTSCSNCTDFQARRSNIRYKTEAGPQFAHTLNGTAVAMSRTLLALMENGQQEDGTIVPPDCLKPYLFGASKK